MYHSIELNRGFVVDLEVSSQYRLGRMHICRGTRLQAQISPMSSKRIKARRKWRTSILRMVRAPDECLFMLSSLCIGRRNGD